MDQKPCTHEELQEYEGSSTYCVICTGKYLNIYTV